VIPNAVRNLWYRAYHLDLHAVIRELEGDWPAD